MITKLYNIFWELLAIVDQRLVYIPFQSYFLPVDTKRGVTRSKRVCYFILFYGKMAFSFIHWKVAIPCSNGILNSGSILDLERTGFLWDWGSAMFACVNEHWSTLYHSWSILLGMLGETCPSFMNGWLMFICPHPRPHQPVVPPPPQSTWWQHHCRASGTQSSRSEQAFNRAWNRCPVKMNTSDWKWLPHYFMPQQRM